MNSVKLYSNGTGVFDRAYTLKGGEPLQVSLPIRNDSLDETIASIGVFGDVSLTEPPSYTPLGYNATNLQIDPYNVTSDLATKLRGARVTLQVASETVHGRLAGIQKFAEAVHNSVLERYRVALFDDHGALRTFADREILSLKFTEERVQAEIDKALQRAYETIKPNSTFVNLTLVPNDDSEVEAHVQYAVAQLGAWKISYRLRAQEKAWELEGHAVVDNSTDEPWDDCLISVITGEPVSFATDLAEIRQVRRSKINVVADQALDALTLEDAMPMQDFDEMEALAGGATIAAYAYDLGAPGDAMSRAATPMRLAAKMAAPQSPRARQATAEVREVGDAVEYTAPFPVSIGANRSAIIPMFSTGLKEANLLLIYKKERHAERPYRAFRFTNDTEHSIGRGVCTLFQEGAYIGKAILEATKPGEERTLPYALESGVRIFAEAGRYQSRRASIQISKGAVVCELVNRTRMTYKIKNNKAEDFKVEIEHSRGLSDATFEVKVAPAGEATLTPIPSGVRIGFAVPAKGAVAVSVLETEVQEQKFGLKGSNGIAWLESAIGAVKPLSREPAIQECLKLQKAVDQANASLAEMEQQVEDILEEQDRLKGLLNLKSGGHESDAHEWRSTLAENEKAIKAAKTTKIPQLRQAVRKAESALQAALSALTVSWTAKENNNTRSDEDDETDSV